jgi:hypothetical protein
MINDGKYNRALSSQYPGLFVILVDQSASMREIEEGSNRSKADLVTGQVNKILQNLIDLAPVEIKPGAGIPTRKTFAYVCVLGYGDSVYSLLAPNFVPVKVPDLQGRMLGTVPVIHEIRGLNGLVERLQENRPVWVKPKAEGNTEMLQALEEAENVIRNWLDSPPELISNEMGYQSPRNQCVPPIVINVTDAKFNGDGDPEVTAEKIRAMCTTVGNVLLCNCLVTDKRNKSCVFPKDIREVEDLYQSKFATLVFNMSSIIPETLRKNAQRYISMLIEPGARCFLYNADLDILIRMLNWGTLGNLRA